MTDFFTNLVAAMANQSQPSRKPVQVPQVAEPSMDFGAMLDELQARGLFNPGKRRTRDGRLRATSIKASQNPDVPGGGIPRTIGTPDDEWRAMFPSAGERAQKEADRLGVGVGETFTGKEMTARAKTPGGFAIPPIEALQGGPRQVSGKFIPLPGGGAVTSHVGPRAPFSGTINGVPAQTAIGMATKEADAARVRAEAVQRARTDANLAEFRKNNPEMARAIRAEVMKKFQR